MKKLICLFIVVLMIVACGPTLLKSRSADINVNKHNYTVYVQAMDSPLTAEITLFVNDQEVAKGTISTNRPTTVISGKYQGVKFDAECGAVKTGGRHMAQRCLIYANSEKVAELSY